MATTKEIYNDIVQALPPTERLRLVTLILNELVQQNLPAIDRKDYWTEQDRADVINSSLQYTDSLSANEEAEQPFYKTVTTEEWIDAFVDWANNHEVKAPPLSDEAISRESIYREREDRDRSPQYIN